MGQQCVVTTLFVGTGGGVFHSFNAGASWAATNTGITDLDIKSLVIDPSSINIMYAGTRSGGVFKSTNFGITWTATNSGLTTLWISALAVDPVSNDTIYAGTLGGGLFKSTDSGATWNAINNGLSGNNIDDVEVDPGNSNIVYASNFSGVFKSVDGGANWVAINDGITAELAFVHDLVIDPNDTDTLYVGTGNGVFKTTDAGVNWSPLGNGLGYTDINFLALDPGTPELLFAATRGLSVHTLYRDDEFELEGLNGTDDFCWGRPVALGVSEKHRHCDADWVRFPALAGRSYVIDTSGLSAFSDTTLSVEFECSGNSLAFDDDGGPGLASRIEFTAPADGDYDVLIGQSNGFNIGDLYKVRIREADIFSGDFESGDLTGWSTVVP